jgi:hypothetical protein
MRNYFKLYTTLASLMLVLFSSTMQAQNALNFDGTNDYVQSTFPGVLGSANRTFEAWVNVNSSATTSNAIIDYGANAVGSRNTFMVNASNGLSFISGGTNANIGTGSNVITSGQWTHVAFVLDNGTGYLYINGVQAGTGSLTSVNTPTTGTDVRIGQRVSGGSIPFSGSIDEVRIWDYARTATEISNDMNDEFCTIPTGLVAYFKLDEGTAGGTNTGVTTAHNLVNSSENGTLTNISLSGATSNWVQGAGIAQGSTSSALNVGTSCGPYTSPSGNYTYTQAGIYTDTLPTSFWCDSIVTIDITAISPNSFATINESACNTYTTPSGNHVFTADGTYMDTIPSATGCDSILTINLSILETFASLNVTGCEEYVAPSGAVFTSSGTYADTIQNSAGCDSIMTLSVFLVGSSQTSITANSCFEYVSPGGKVFDESGVYLDTVVSSIGCDSILSITLTINSFNQSVNATSNALISSVLGASYQWYDCSENEIVAGETNQAFIPSSSSEYAVIVTKDGCTDTSDCVAFNKIGIENLEVLQDLVVFPNPTSGMVSLSLKSQEKIQSVEILNVDGSVVSAFEALNENEVSVNPSLASGLYFVRVIDQNNQAYIRSIIFE